MEKIIKNILIVISLIIYWYLLYIVHKWYFFDSSYLRGVILIILICLMLFFYGIIENNNKTYRNNVYLYIILYFILLISVTFIIGRDKLRFYDWWYGGQYKLFHTISTQIKYATFKSFFKNIIGNSVMLIPLSFLLMIKDKKYNNVLRQMVVILPTVILIEMFQGFTHTGIFDIDDIFLNYIGTLIFTFLITRFHLIDKIRNLFYKDYKINIKVKKILFYLSVCLLIIFEVIILIIR